MRTGATAAIRSFLFTLFLFSSVPIYAFPVMLSAVLPHVARYSIVRQWARMVLRLLDLLCGLRFDVSGREHLPAEPSVVLMKHQSAWETIAEVLVFPRQTWVLKRELMWVPFLGWALAALRPIAIDRRGRHSALEQVIAQGRARLESGLWVVVFPEGTRVAPGKTGRYGLGGAALARAAGAPVVPVAHNAGFYWGRRGLIKRAGTIRVRIGPPILPGQRSPQEITEAARNWIEAAAQELAAAAQQELRAEGTSDVQVGDG